jgi:hypothetical protein
MKDYIEKNTFKEKPTYFRKSIHSGMEAVQKIKSISKFTLISPLELYYKIKYESFHKISQDEDKCTICLDTLYEVKKEQTLDEILKINEDMAYKFNVIMLDKCTDHFFHLDCMSDMIGDNEFIKCPVCNKIYGILKGTQPPGTMYAYVDSKIKCAGFKEGSIMITYHFDGGKGYSGTTRQAYLPDNKEGRKTLGLLKICFDRKLIFTVGTSVTTGATNTTVWAGIHHKTNVSGGI